MDKTRTSRKQGGKGGLEGQAAQEQEHSNIGERRLMHNLTTTKAKTEGTAGHFNHPVQGDLFFIRVVKSE